MNRRVVKKIEFQDVIAYLYEKRFVCTTSTTISFKSSKYCRIVCSLLLTRQGMIMVRSIPISLCSKVQAWYLEYLTEQCLVSQYIKELGSVNAMRLEGYRWKCRRQKTNRSWNELLNLSGNGKGENTNGEFPSPTRFMDICQGRKLSTNRLAKIIISISVEIILTLS